jgi:hypothetical protein
MRDRVYENEQAEALRLLICKMNLVEWRHLRTAALGRLDALVIELEGLQGFKRSVDEALNSGDGSYRP